MELKSLASIIADFHERELPLITKRDMAVPLQSGKVITITGPRRCGKTYYMYQIAKQLIDKGVSKDRIIYLNFEDERIGELNPDDIFSAYLLLYPKSSLKGIYLLFDEIQNLMNWEKFIMRVSDTITDRIFITGSNSEVFRDNLSSAMIGRILNYELSTLSYREYLRFFNIDEHDKTMENRIKLETELKGFIEFGGFPELIGMEKSTKIKVLQEYFNVMIYRDLIESYGLSNPNVTRQIMKKIIISFAKEYSVKKVFNELKSQGFKISKKTVYGIVEKSKNIYFTDFLYQYKAKENALNEIRKIYLSDIGYAVGEMFGSDEINGRKIENVLFNHLKQKYRLNYLRNHYEIDFIFDESGKKTGIQITWALNKENINRETSSLLRLIEEKKINKAEIVVMSKLPDKLLIDKRIKVFRFYDYLLI